MICVLFLECSRMSTTLPIWSFPNKNRLTQPLQKLAAILMLFGLLTILLPRGCINTAVVGGMILVLLAGDWKQNLQLIWQSRVAMLMLLLAAMFYISVLYTAAQIHDGLNLAHKYLWLAYPVVLLPVFVHSFSKKLWFEAALLCFTLGVLAVCLRGISDAILGTNLHHWIAIDGKIRFGPSISIAAFISLHQAFVNQRLRWLYTIIFIIITYALLAALSTRTGYVCFVVAMLLFLVQRHSLKVIIAGAVLMVMAVLLAYYFSPDFHQGVHELIWGVYQMLHGNEGSSSGERINMIHSGLIIWQHSPLFGFGTGSYGTVYHHYITSNPNYHLVPIDTGPIVGANSYIEHITNPHNEFMATLVQLGLAGIGLLVGLLIECWIQSCQLPKTQGDIGQAIVLVFIVASFTSAILYTDKRYCFVMLIGLVFFSIKHFTAPQHSTHIKR